MKDEKDISRQARSQRKNRANGLCVSCSTPSNGKSLCDKCAERHGTKKRHLLKSEWEAMDWTMTDTQIIEIHNVSKQAVYLNRRKYGGLTHKQAKLASLCEETWNTCYPERKPWADIDGEARAEWLKVFGTFASIMRKRKNKSNIPFTKDGV